MKDESNEKLWYLAAKLPLVERITRLQPHKLVWIHWSSQGVRQQPFTLCSNCGKRITEEQVNAEKYGSCTAAYLITPVSPHESPRTTPRRPDAPGLVQARLP